MVLPNEHRPYSISGYFYHSHENDEKWNRDEFGGWKTNGIRKNASNKPKTKHYPRQGYIFWVDYFKVIFIY